MRPPETSPRRRISWIGEVMRGIASPRASAGPDATSRRNGCETFDHRLMARIDDVARTRRPKPVKAQIHPRSRASTSAFGITALTVHPVRRERASTTVTGRMLKSLPSQTPGVSVWRWRRVARRGRPTMEAGSGIRARAIPSRSETPVIQPWDVFPAQDALEPVHRREKAQQVDDLALVLHRDGDGVGRPIGHAARQDAGDHGPLRSGCQLTVERQGGLRQWGPARDRRIDQLLPVRLAQEDVEPDGFANEACLGVEILELRILQAGRRRQGLQHGDEPRRVAVDGQGDAANVLAGILLEPCPLCSGIAKQQDRGEQKPGSDQRHDEGDQVDLGREASIPDACEQPARRRALPPTGSRPFESRFHLALGLGALRLLVLDLGFPRLGVHGLSM